MTSQSYALTSGAVAARRSRAGQATSSLTFDRLYVLASAWLLGGLFVDGWAHINLRNLETFFTPWHGLFYSGFFAVVAVLGFGIGRGRAAGFSGWRIIPAGYELSAIGAALFAVGGVLDMLWHIAFGIEADLEALLSPTHLLLASGLALILSGPFRAAWRRADRAKGEVADGWRAQLPMLLSLTFVLGLFSFFTQYVHPLSSAEITLAWGPAGSLGATLRTAGGRELEVPFLFQAPMLAGIIVHAALLVGTLLLALRRARLPLGAMTLLIVPLTVMMVLMRTRFNYDVQLSLVAAAFIAGVLADVLLAVQRPTFDRPLSVRLFAAALPILVFGAYFGVLMVTSGLWWSIHLWAGAIFLAAVVGWLMAMLATPGRSVSLGVAIGTA